VTERGEEDGGYRQKCQPPRACHAKAFEAVPSRGADAQGGAMERNANPMHLHHNEAFKAALSRGTDAQGEDKCTPRQGVQGGTVKGSLPLFCRVWHIICCSLPLNSSIGCTEFPPRILFLPIFSTRSTDHDVRRSAVALSAHLGFEACPNTLGNLPLMHGNIAHDFYVPFAFSLKVAKHL
jgi:hypothetical protein